MFDTEELIVSVFCCVDDGFKELTQAQPIRSRGFSPALSDAEVMTMEIVGEYQGFDADKVLWQYFRDHWLSLFPQLPSRSTFVCQGANLWQYKQRLQQLFAHRLGAFDDKVHLVDGFPVSLCCLTYAGRCRSFPGEASYGYCAAKDEKFFGFRGHLLVSSEGAIAGFSLTGANGDEREALWELLAQVEGLLIGDKGYISEFLRQELKRSGLELQTPWRSNMRDVRPHSWNSLASKCAATD